MLKLNIVLGADRFEFEGDASFVEVRPLVVEFFQAQGVTQQAALDALTDQLQQDNTQLHDDVVQSTPTAPS